MVVKKKQTALIILGVHTLFKIYFHHKRMSRLDMTTKVQLISQHQQKSKSVNQTDNSLQGSVLEMLPYKKTAQELWYIAQKEYKLLKLLNTLLFFMTAVRAEL